MTIVYRIGFRLLNMETVSCLLKIFELFYLFTIFDNDLMCTVYSVQCTHGDEWDVFNATSSLNLCSIGGI